MPVSLSRLALCAYLTAASTAVYAADPTVPSDPPLPGAKASVPDKARSGRLLPVQGPESQAEVSTVLPEPFFPSSFSAPTETEPGIIAKALAAMTFGPEPRKDGELATAQEAPPSSTPPSVAARRLPADRSPFAGLNFAVPPKQPVGSAALSAPLADEDQMDKRKPGTRANAESDSASATVNRFNLNRVSGLSFNALHQGLASFSSNPLVIEVVTAPASVSSVARREGGTRDSRATNGASLETATLAPIVSERSPAPNQRSPQGESSEANSAQPIASPSGGANGGNGNTGAPSASRAGLGNETRSLYDRPLVAALPQVIASPIFNAPVADTPSSAPAAGRDDSDKGKEDDDREGRDRGPRAESPKPTGPETAGNSPRNTQPGPDLVQSDKDKDNRDQRTNRASGASGTGGDALDKRADSDADSSERGHRAARGNPGQTATESETNVVANEKRGAARADRKEAGDDRAEGKAGEQGNRAASESEVAQGGVLVSALDTSSQQSFESLRRTSAANTGADASGSRNRDGTEPTRRTASHAGSARLHPDLEHTQFIPTPVPEPSTWVMLLAGLAGLAGVTRMRKRRDGTS